MKVNLEYVFKQRNGLDIEVDQGEKFTLAAALCQCLDHPLEDDNRDLNTSLKRGRLANKIYAGGEATLTADEVAMIVARAPSVFAPLIVVQIVERIDPARLSA